MSCNDKQSDVTAPTVLLSESEMVDVMTDVYIIENAINYRRGKGTKITNLKTNGFDAVFTHYGINDSIFKKNVEYYNDSPVVMKRIMDSVNVRFSNIQQKLKQNRKRVVKFNDSFSLSVPYLGKFIITLILHSLLNVFLTGHVSADFCNNTFSLSVYT